VASFATAQAIMKAFPETEEGISFGTPSFRVRKKFIGRLREPDVLVVKVEDLLLRDGLIQAKPSIYFITPHYEDYPAVLVRLSQIGEAELEDLLTDAWYAAAPKRLAKAFAEEQAADSPSA
jgi:hypothetical protein